MTDFMRTRATAKETHVPEYLLRRMIHNGTAPGFFAGRTFYFNVPALLAKLSKMSETRADVRTAME